MSAYARYRERERWHGVASGHRDTDPQAKGRFPGRVTSRYCGRPWPGGWFSLPLVQESLTARLWGSTQHLGILDL
jgi:hypothetical protein